MARSLAKIKEQIAKLQHEADSIQSGVIARIRKDIAQFDLTVDQLFGASAVAPAKNASNGKRTVETRTTATKRKASGKPPKYADDQGNAWGGMGKRPQWVRAAIEAGRSLEEFLVKGAKRSATSRAKPAVKAASKTAPAKKSRPKVQAKAAPAPAKRAIKTAAKTVITKKPRVRKATTASLSSTEQPTS